MRDEPDYVEDHGLHVGPIPDLMDAPEPLPDEGGGSSAPGFAHLETGPSESGVLTVPSSDVIGDGGDSEHRIKATPVDSGYFMDGPVGGRFIGSVHDHRPFRAWEAGKFG